MKWAVCMDNHGYEADLELRKLYQIVADEKSANRGCIRVIDESGEDYVYPAEMFMPVDFPQSMEARLSALTTA